MSRAVARLCSLPLILFFVGYNVRGENACPSVPLLPHGFDCPFQNEKVKGCLRQFFSMLPIADPQAEAHGSTEKNKPLTISFFHFQSHPRGSKLNNNMRCFEIGVRIVLCVELKQLNNNMRCFEIAVMEDIFMQAQVKQ